MRDRGGSGENFTTTLHPLSINRFSSIAFYQSLSINRFLSIAFYQSLSINRFLSIYFYQ